MAYSQIRLRNGRLFHGCMDFMQLSALSSSQCTWILNASGPSVSVLRLKAICSTDIWRPLRPDSPKKDSERSEEWWQMDSRCFQRGATKFPPNFLGTSPMEKVQHMVQVLPGIPKWHKKPKCDNHTDARLRQRTHKKAYTNWIYFFLDDINKAQTDRCLTNYWFIT